LNLWNFGNKSYDPTIRWSNEEVWWSYRCEPGIHGGDRGEIYGLIGPNGAGKTTLLNTIAGVYKPNEGQVRFLGADISNLAPEKVTRRGIARTFQSPHSFAKMTALENVMVAATFGCREVEAKPYEFAEKMLDVVKFPMEKDVSAKSLNVTQLKRLDLARALACKPKLLMLDEPASGLNPSEMDDYMGLFRSIRDMGITIIIVEHLMRMIMAICDRMLVLNYGSKIAEGTPMEIRSNPVVIDAYLGTS
jgi:branched-chain amino acid transport system ATP-binding protein